MLRVVQRLERLSESLLDFARVRPHRSQTVALQPLIEEAWTLVRLDREARQIRAENRISASLTAWGDPDRLLQVLVNLLRNAADAMLSGGTGPGRLEPEIVIEAERLVRDGRPWASIRISDNGPGIPPEMLSRLFQPFVSTRLDAKGTGLGLAVSEGIIREHGGVILVRNRADRGGAEFEVLLPDVEDSGGSVQDAADAVNSPALESD
jgi:two-component system sensor histidine kinase HupT/HoxJ